MSPEISVYGADWCEDTRRTRAFLDELGLPYRYVNVDKDEDASRKVMEWNGGRRVTPTVVMSSPTGTIRLAEPSDEELEESLSRHGYLGAA